MIKTQIVKEGNKPVAVILDYQEYKRLKEIEEDKSNENGRGRPGRFFLTVMD